MKFKYVKFYTKCKGDQIVLFGQNTVHDDICRAIKKIGGKPITAGFVDIDVRGEPYGRSVSAELDSDSEKDSELLKHLDL